MGRKLPVSRHRAATALLALELRVGLREFYHGLHSGVTGCITLSSHPRLTLSIHSPPSLPPPALPSIHPFLHSPIHTSVHLLLLPSLPSCLPSVHPHILSHFIFSCSFSLPLFCIFYLLFFSPLSPHGLSPSPFSSILSSLALLPSHPVDHTYLLSYFHSSLGTMLC